MRIRTRRWTRLEYERAIDRGIFREDERLELVDGLLVVREPQGDLHAAAVDLVGAALRRAFGDGWLVRAHAPLALGRRSRPEPDISVVRGAARDYRSAAPTCAALVVEVSHSSLAFDRTRKALVYARAGIAEYWIVDLRHMLVEVHHEPVRVAAPGRGWRYRSFASVHRGESIAPLAAPGASVAVDDLLP